MDTDNLTSNAIDNGQTVLPDDPTQTESPSVPAGPAGSGRCLLYGCSAVFITGIFLILCAGFATYFYFTRQVESFTSETPQILPSQEYDDKKMVELETRVQEFERMLDPPQEEPAEKPVALPTQKAVADQPEEVTEPKPSAAPIRKPKRLVLSAADLNALISRHPQFRNRLFVKIDQGVISGDVSLPLDGFVPGGEGRFFNGSGKFDVGLNDGELVVRLIEAMVAGQPIPPAVMSGIRKQNLAERFQDDAKLSRAIRRFERIEVDGDRMILTLKGRKPAAAKPE
ncbi:hypothetical protein LF1_13120 [Rubripirellula obstinata]|uniref:Uncharacterized protein n=1 Tax=Rubripirellula obstinata TaxID=406547 RepID=A0A5B1CGB3_9BACT|nr:hypothetical protein [Rubripirellula obstinata]KAA1258789.1 hypothetical protein LF1_13120 [Rubripirellula obstinata]